MPKMQKLPGVGGGTHPPPARALRALAALRCPTIKANNLTHPEKKILHTAMIRAPLFENPGSAPAYM